MHRSWALIGLVVVTVLDRSIKTAVVEGYTWTGAGVTVQLYKNTGLVFSVPINSTLALLVMLLATTWLGWLFFRTLRLQARPNFGLVLMLLGAFSNLYDRIRFGYVVDWLYIGDWALIVNLADIMILTGLILYVRRRATITRTVDRSPKIR